MEIFSERLKELWNLWEIRSLVLLSLLLQIILIIFGSRRKITNPHSRIGILLNVTIWCAYIAADWVATVALSVMASSRENCQHDSSEASNRLHTFWAPFLLLHLGGPDTITAFSMEDNDLWGRHLLGLIVEVGVAFYAFTRFWSTNALTFLAVPVFITGIVKYGERTWVLWSSSTPFNNSRGSFPSWLERARNNADLLEDRILADGYWLYHILTCNVIVGHLYIHGNEEDSYRTITNYQSAEDAFRVVATEVGVMYDVLYTKANIVYSLPGIVLRCLSFICTITALVLFFIIIDGRSYQKFDIVVTYVLLVGAVVLETYAFIILLSSDWTKLWLISLRNASRNQISGTLVDIFQRLTNCLHSSLTAKNRWSESIGQYRLMWSVREERQCMTYRRLGRLSCASKLLRKYHYLSWENVISLQDKIFRPLKDVVDEQYLIRRTPSDFRRARDGFLSRRGGYALRDYASLRDSLDAEDYDARVIMWHIVTNKCYERESQPSEDCKIGKWISDYMVYLLLFRPSIFPKGIGQLRYEHTLNHIVYPSNTSHPTAYSVMERADTLALGLIRHVEDDNRWQIIINVWLELLLHVASHFEWKEHAEYLRRGGELVTLISVLMINFGFSKQMT